MEQQESERALSKCVAFPCNLLSPSSPGSKMGDHQVSIWNISMYNLLLRILNYSNYITSPTSVDFLCPTFKKLQIFSLLISTGRKVELGACDPVQSDNQRCDMGGGGSRKVSNSSSPCPASRCKLGQAKKIIGENNCVLLML